MKVLYLVAALLTLTACATTAPPLPPIPPTPDSDVTAPVPVTPDPHDGPRPSATPVPGPRAATPRAAVTPDGLTSDEKADIARFVRSAILVREAKDWLLPNIAKYTTAATRDTLHAALFYYERALGEHYVALANFLHVGHIGAGAGPAGFNVHEPDQPDTKWLADAWAAADLYVGHLVNMQKQVTAATKFFPASSGVDAASTARSVEWQRNVSVASARLTAARTLVTAMTRTLPYAHPWPALRVSATAVPFTIRTAVGPHGRYRLMQWDINRGKNYIGNAQVAVLPEYKKGADGQKIAHIWVQDTALRNGLDIAGALLAGVTFDADQAADDRFCQVLRVVKILTVSVPTAFNNWQASIGALIPQPWANFVSISGDAWRHIDFGTWSSMVFPESTRCASPFLRN
jgi:hypothetical protein